MQVIVKVFTHLDHLSLPVSEIPLRDCLGAYNPGKGQPAYH